MKTAVLGASGYGGQALMRLLMGHPEVSTLLPVSSTAAGRPIEERDAGIGPDPSGKRSEVFLSLDDALAQRPDALFSALPHGISASRCAPFFGSSVVFDLSADFRLKDAAAHEKAYGVPAPFLKLRERAVYGLAEWEAAAIRSTDLIAVPGCYPTCVLLPLLPLLRANLISPPIVINALSGISGAGRSARETSLYVERAENAVAYNPGRRHRHVPEMAQGFKEAGYEGGFSFTPHLVPMRRGMAVTITAPGRGNADQIQQVLADAYGEQPFIRLRGQTIPATREVTGSNRCDIGWMAEEGEEIHLFSVLDNLLKGAAGQAVQDFNIRFGFPVETGLPLKAEV